MIRTGATLLFLGCALLVRVGTATADETATKQLSFNGVIEVAVSDSPELALSKLAIGAAEAHHKASRARYYPQLIVEANAMMWGSEIAFALPLPCMDDPMTPANECPMGVSMESITVRERFTASATVTVAQPITPLWPINEAVKIDKAAISVAEAEHRTTRLEVAYRAAEGYVRLLQARAARDIADTGVAQLTAHLDRARVLKEGGVLETVDVMRIEAALASARQRAIAASRHVGLAGDGLVFVLGLPAGTALAIVDDLPASPPAPPVLDAGQLDAAAAGRPEVEIARQRSEQARAAAAIEWMRLVPHITAVATYQRNQGGGTFQAADDWFLGLTMHWDAWDWGRQRKLKQSAELDAERAKLASARYQQRVRLEVKRAASDASSAYEGLAVASSGLGVAEEAFRIQRERFTEGALSATDLLDAETEVARSRLGYANARYEYYIALVALARATGQLPDTVVSGNGRVE